MDKERIAGRLQPPEPDLKGRVVSFVKAIVGGSPIPWSGSAVEVISLIFTPSYQKRIELWRGIVADIVLELYNRKHLTIDDLKNDEEFVSVMQQASITAFKTHQEEKRKLLSNALFNSTDKELQYDKKKVFLNLMDEFTLTHIHILQRIHEHAQHLIMVKKVRDLNEILTTGGKDTNFEEEGFIPADYPTHLTELNYILVDLQGRNLLYISDAFEFYAGGVLMVDVRVSEDSKSSGKPLLAVSELGIQFLKFIAEEPDKEANAHAEKGGE